MNNIFITGASGFLGANLVKHFITAGLKVTAVIRANGSRESFDQLNCHVIEYDGSISSLQECLDSNTTVIHTASYYVAEHTSQDLPVLIESNLKYGLDLLEAMRTSGARRILNIGTAWQGYEGVDRRPVNLYAATKQSFEDLIAYYCDAEEFSAISLRLNDTYGEEDKRMKLLKLLISRGVNQKALDMSGGEQIINITHVEDVCRAISFAINIMPECSNIDKYNLQSNSNFSLRELAKLIEDEIGIAVPINWSVKEYRRREVMIPTNNFPLKGFVFEYNIRDGIRLIYDTLKAKTQNRSEI
ncbi:MAG: NAD(P)-dependent oxidoreductase [Oceanospirillaceae bacterium]|nr:NAD(P)-dependent oxidoreductase [Colwellia sp.]NQZ32148.1 NAD(P)-dependent oxidoreductase [Oceanospirillaceae bacterium]